MKRILLPLIVLLSLTGIPPLQAEIVDDLYTVELPVADQTTSQRLELFKQAFREVVTKVSGSVMAVESPGFERPLNNSSRYVHQFRYVVRKDENSDEFDSGQLMLSVVFNKDAIDNLLRENAIAIWGKERPSTLLLISYNVNKDASIVSSDTTPAVVKELDELSARKGLPVLFPLLDLEDRVQLGIQDIIDLNANSIGALASRYAPDAVLVGQIIGQAGKGWQGIWQARFSDQEFNWNFKSSSRQDIMDQAIAGLAQILASEYALQSYQAVDEYILFTVDQMFQVTDHIKVQSYLQSLDAIESLRLVLISDDRVTYRVKLRHAAEDLSRLIGLGYVLEQLELPQIDAAANQQTVTMNYRLIH